MSEFEKNFENEPEDLHEDYLSLQKRSRIIRQSISIFAALLILTASVFAALLTNAARRNKTPNDTSQTNSLSDISIIESNGDVSDEESALTSETESKSDTSSTVSETSSETSKPILYGVTIDSIYLYGDVGLQYFASSSVAENKFADALNAYRNAFDSNVRMYSFIVPTYAEFYKFEDGRKVGQSQKDSIARINSKLAEGITPIDLVSALEAHSDEYIYFRTDTNWTPLGAYYAYEKFMEEIGDEPVALKDYEMGTIDEFIGACYLRTKADQLLENPDYVDFYRVDKKYPKSLVTQYFHDGTVYKNSQLVFRNVAGIHDGYQIFGAETRYVSVKTEAKTGRKLLILRENSAAAFIPFLMPHFDEIHAVDTRYFAKHSNLSITDFVKEFGITDVAFMYYTTSANNGTRINEINALLTERNSN